LLLQLLFINLLGVVPSMTRFLSAFIHLAVKPSIPCTPSYTTFGLTIALSSILLGTCLGLFTPTSLLPRGYCDEASNTQTTSTPSPVKDEMQYFFRASTRVHVVNPNAKTNPIAGELPGFRGPNQLVLYNRFFTAPTTETNEFGFEATILPINLVNPPALMPSEEQAKQTLPVKPLKESPLSTVQDTSPLAETTTSEDPTSTPQTAPSEDTTASEVLPSFSGLVVLREGHESTIPQEGFVLSGHGAMRDWLVKYAPLGARIHYNPSTKTLESMMDLDGYWFQFQEKLKRVERPSVEFQEALEAFQQKLQQKVDAQAYQEAAAMLSNAHGETTFLDEALWRQYPSFAQEAPKGVWIRPVETSREAIGKRLDQFQRAGLNTIFLETYFHGMTIFPSETFERYHIANGHNPRYQGIDILGLWVEEAHRRNMKLHAWLHTFYGGSQYYQSPGPVLRKYPSWANVQYSALRKVQECYEVPVESASTSDTRPSPATAVLTVNKASLGVKDAKGSKQGTPSSEGKPEPPKTIKQCQTYVTSPARPVHSTLEDGAYFLDPANPDVKEFLQTLVLEMATRYPIDGIQFDYIRYPNSMPPLASQGLITSWGYSDAGRLAFKKQFNRDPVTISPAMADLWGHWTFFKQTQVTEFVKETGLKLHEQRPELITSAVIFADTFGALRRKCQNWVLWGQEKYVDWLMPIVMAAAPKQVEKEVSLVREATHQQVPVVAGVFAPYFKLGPETLLDQIRYAKEAQSLGFTIFEAAHITPLMYRAMQVNAQSPQASLTSKPSMKAPLTHTLQPPSANTASDERSHDVQKLSPIELKAQQDVQRPKPHGLVRVLRAIYATQPTQP
ncbi:MAG: glycoside hydrolase family 10 protein, partial [Vampirovibrionales bacterium]